METSHFRFVGCLEVRSCQRGWIFDLQNFKELLMIILELKSKQRRHDIQHNDTRDNELIFDT